MTASRDTERLIRAFLDEGVTELPERVYDVVRSDIDRTHQRVVIGPWRTPDMNTFAKFAIAAAAVLVVAFVGWNLLPGDTGRGGTPSVSPSPSITASPMSPRASRRSRHLSRGPSHRRVHSVGSHPIQPERRRLPSRSIVNIWLGEQRDRVQPDGGTIQKGTKATAGAAWILIWSIDVYADPCAGAADRSARYPSAALASAVAGIPSIDRS